MADKAAAADGASESANVDDKAGVIDLYFVFFFFLFDF